MKNSGSCIETGLSQKIFLTFLQPNKYGYFPKTSWYQALPIQNILIKTPYLCRYKDSWFFGASQ